MRSETPRSARDRGTPNLGIDRSPIDEVAAQGTEMGKSVTHEDNDDYNNYTRVSSPVIKKTDRSKGNLPHPLRGMEDLQEVDNTTTEMSASSPGRQPSPYQQKPTPRDSVVFEGANILNLTLFDKDGQPAMS